MVTCSVRARRSRYLSGCLFIYIKDLHRRWLSGGGAVAAAVLLSRRNSIALAKQKQLESAFIVPV